jgi:hypothetical protein
VPKNRFRAAVRLAMTLSSISAKWARVGGEARRGRRVGRRRHCEEAASPSSQKLSCVRRFRTCCTSTGNGVQAAGGRTLDVQDPATGTTIATISDAAVADGKSALDAAVGAQESWAPTPPRVRGGVLRRAFICCKTVSTSSRC